MREDIARNVPGAPNVQGKMGPHLTLAVFDHQDQAEVTRIFASFAADFRGFSVKFHKLGFFDGLWKILYAAPLPQPELLDLRLRAHSTFSGVAVMVPHYRDPADWIPHVTLSKGLKDRVFQDAMAYAEERWKPVTASAWTTGLVNVQRPLEVLASRSVK